MRSLKIPYPYGLIIKFGLLAGSAVILFESVNLFVLYRQIRLDLYLSIIAATSLLAGAWIRKERNSKPRMSTSSATPAANPHIDYKLTSKELEVLSLIASGKANKEIAALLYVEMSTVKTHINNIYSKLSITNRRDAKTRYTELIRQNHTINA